MTDKAASPVLSRRFATTVVAGWLHDALEINGLHPKHCGYNSIEATFGGRTVVVTVTTRRDNTDSPVSP